MPDFVYIKCPNCHIKIKLDKEKKYHDCPDCKFEFRLDQIEDQLKSAPAPEPKKESIFGKFLKENENSL